MPANSHGSIRPQAWPLLLPGQLQAQPDFQMWSALENLPPGSPTPVWCPIWTWETPKIESFCHKKEGEWEESWIYDACKVSTQFWHLKTLEKPCEARRATGETSTWKGSDVLGGRIQECEHLDDQPKRYHKFASVWRIISIEWWLSDPMTIAEAC